MTTSATSRDRASRTTEAPPETAPEALAQARRHAHSALSETLAAIRALIDVASLTLTGAPSQSHPLLGPVARVLDGICAELDAGTAGESLLLLRSIAEALDSEIARWEDRAENDVEARAVLRAFLGIRELLWEFGVRREPKTSETSGRGARRAGRASPTRRKSRRVQRVTVEG